MSMRTFDPEFVPTTVSAEAFAGQYTCYDDGWAGGLRLAADDPSTLSGRYTSFRFGTNHTVSAQITGPLSHKIQLNIHDFNGLAEQPCTGYLATEGRGMIAGYTQWRDEVLGFYARRDVPRALPAFRPGEAVPADFAGRYILRCDGGPASVELTHEGERRLSGHWRHRDDRPYDITGEVDRDNPLLVRLTLSTQAADAALTGYLFSRPKNLVTGWIDTQRARIGCCLVRIG
jgi:hypothetical protein